MFRFGLALAVVGSAFFYLALQESRLAAVAEERPQSISCAQLAGEGYGDNAHVTVTDFTVCDVWFVYEGESEDGPWNRIWVPLVPSDSDWAEYYRGIHDENGQWTEEPKPPTDIRIILRTSKVKNDQDVLELAQQTSLTGLVVNEIDSLASDEKRLLSEQYQIPDFDKVWILDQGRTPAPAFQMYLGFGGGPVLIVTGIVVVLLSFRKRG